MHPNIDVENLQEQAKKSIHQDMVAVASRGYKSALENILEMVDDGKSVNDIRKFCNLILKNL